MVMIASKLSLKIKITITIIASKLLSKVSEGETNKVKVIPVVTKVILSWRQERLWLNWRQID